MYILNEDTNELEQTPDIEAKLERAVNFSGRCINGSIRIDYQNVIIPDDEGLNLADYTEIRKRRFQAYSKLFRVCKLLFAHGRITSYTIRGNGDIRINWFDGYVKPDVKVIVPKFTSDEIRDISGPQSNSHTKLLAWYDYYPMPATCNSEELIFNVTRDKRESIYPTIKLNKAIRDAARVEQIKEQKYIQAGIDAEERELQAERDYKLLLKKQSKPDYSDLF